MSSFIFILILACASFAAAANILLISPVPSVSHSFWYDNIAAMLAGAGHQVTLINTKEPKKLAENTTYYIIETKHLYTDDLSDIESFSKLTSPFYSAYLILGGWTTIECKHLMESKAIKKFIDDFNGKPNSFDLVIFDGGTCECFLGLVDVVGRPPLIIATAFDAAFGFKLFFGNPDNPSVSPSALAMFTENMSFLERVENTLIEAFSRLLFYYYYFPGQSEIAHAVLGKDSLNIEDIGRNASLFFVGTHYSHRVMKSMPPNVIPIAGIQLSQPEKLPPDLQKFLDGAKQGAIFFSFGSNVLCEWIKEDKLEIILDTLRQLKYHVLWTCNSKGLNLPTNVKVAKWFPQKDILAHPNLKLFITHGGLLSFQEAMYHGVPLVVVPFFGDQHATSYQVEQKGLGVRFLFHELKSSSQFVNAIEKVISDPRFKKKASDVSRLFKPFADTTKSTFLHWVDFIVQNPDLKIPKDASTELYWFQLFLLDVLGALLVAAMVAVLITYYVFRFTLRLCCKSQKKMKVKTK